MWCAREDWVGQGTGRVPLVTEEGGGGPTRRRWVGSGLKK